MTPPSPMKLAGVACAALALTGCAAGARMTATQPDQPPPFDELSLRGKWAFFDTSPETERILLAFAHPGAVDGRRQYFLYLQTPPEKRTYVFGAIREPVGPGANAPHADAQPSGADAVAPEAGAASPQAGAGSPHDDTTEPRAEGHHSVRGFFLQSEGAMAGLTELVSGRVQVGGSPFDGGRLRLGRFELLCADGTQLSGRFTAKQNFLEMRTFEEDLYPADVRALVEAAGSEPPPAPGQQAD